MFTPLGDLQSPLSCEAKKCIYLSLGSQHTWNPIFVSYVVCGVGHKVGNCIVFILFLPNTFSVERRGMVGLLHPQALKNPSTHHWGEPEWLSQLIVCLPAQVRIEESWDGARVPHWALCPSGVCFSLSLCFPPHPLPHPMLVHACPRACSVSLACSLSNK